MFDEMHAICVRKKWGNFAVLIECSRKLNPRGAGRAKRPLKMNKYNADGDDG